MSSPTVVIPSVCLTSVIHTSENREVLILDVPGAYINTDVEDIVNVMLDGTYYERDVYVTLLIYSIGLSEGL